MTRNLFIIFSLILSTITLSSAINQFEDEFTYRLPNDTRPLTYDVSLRTWIDAAIFDFIGNVKIVLVVESDTDVITLHHRQLTIQTVTLTRIATSEAIPIEPFQYEVQREFLQIPVTESGILIVGEQYLLDIDFNGTLRNDQAGFYRSYYTVGAERVYQATTQFESTDARHGFPCYDEPALKANFTIRVTHGNTYNAESNMPVVSITVVDENTVTTEFEETPLMSSYLIAFIISDFLHTTAVSPNNGLTHRAFSRGSYVGDTLLALQSGIDLLDALEDYLQVPYSLPKMDQYAIPVFAAGAMENWGIITYRETSFLWDVNTNLYTAKTGIVRTISHELVHQWFGDLVSPAWWTYLWLNEGFASFYASYIVDWAYPEWRLVEYYVANTLQSVFSTDATGNSRPMTYYVESPNEIDRIFDSIAYDKSGCVIRMMMHAFGTDTFRKGLGRYLIARSYMEATQEHLFAGIQEAVTEDGTLAEGLTVQSIFSSWSTQSGFPILYVNRNYADGSVRIGQERYLTNPTGTIHEYTYWIPITYTTASDADFSDATAVDWLAQNERWKTLNIDASSDEWIIFNKQQSGYYRVQYDRQNWHLIADGLLNDYQSVHLLSRGQLIDDSFTFARTNRLDFEIPFSIIRYLKYEAEYAPWASAIRHLNFLNRYITGVDNYLKYRDWLAELTSYYFSQIGVDDIPDEPQLMKYSRTNIVNWACAVGATNCRYEANQRLKRYTFDDEPIHQNIRTVMLCAGMRNADLNDFGMFWDRRNENGYLTALGCMTDPFFLELYLNQIVNTLSISAATRNNIFISVHQGSYEGLVMAVQFLRRNFYRAAELLGSTGNVNSALTALSQRAMNDELLTEFNMILEAAEMNPIHVNSVNTARNNIFTNQQWLILHKHTVDNFLIELE